MVSSPMYDRLMEFANSAPDNEKLYGWDDEHSVIVKAIREARDKVEHFKEYQGSLARPARRCPTRPCAQSSASTSKPTST